MSKHTRSETGPLPTNYLLAERYRIIDMVGEGGMGIVYQAIDELRNEKCAIKEMSSAKLTQVTERHQAILNFEREAKMLGRLDHPNLPKVTDYRSHEGRHYIVMEFVEGQTLAELIEAIGQGMSIEKVTLVAKQLCDAIDYLHNQDPPIIFRDLKPSNIMLQPDGQVKLIDFGIARFFSSGKKWDTESLGTEGFVAPEVYRGRQTDVRSDIYSLGMTLYNLLTGQDPPDHNDLDFDFLLSELAAYDSPDLNRVILKSIQENPSKRPQSVEEIRREARFAKHTAANIFHPATESHRSGGRIRKITKQLTGRLKQMPGRSLLLITIILIVSLGVLTWIVGPWIREQLPLIWHVFPFYFAAGPFMPFLIVKVLPSWYIFHFI